jgi:hypothetical protein
VSLQTKSETGDLRFARFERLLAAIETEIRPAIAVVLLPRSAEHPAFFKRFFPMANRLETPAQQPILAYQRLN